MSTLEDRIENLNDKQRQFLAEILDGEQSAESNAGQRHLVAWYRSTRDLSAQELRSHLTEHLPTSVVPRHFLRVEEIPKTPSGKIARDQLTTSRTRRPHQNPPSSSQLTQTESALLKAARETLGTNEIHLDDDFFEVGGDSLTSIKLIALARQEGLLLEPQDVFDNSTFRQLAAKSDQRRRPNRQDQSSIPSRLFQMRSSDQRKSVLLIHEIGGSCHYAHYLAPLLNSSWSLFGSHQQTPKKAPNQKKDISSIASEMIDEWLSMHPSGSRCIVSFCWGGLLAYEIARQLKQRDINLDRLVIIESGTDASFRHAGRFGWSTCWVRGAISRVARRFSSKGFLGLIGAMTKRHPNAPVDFRFRPEDGDPELIQQNVQSFLHYQPNPSDVAVDLMRTREQHLIAGKFVDRSLGWRFLTDQLSVHLIPGGHADCVQPPHVETLAQQIDELLTANS